MDQFGTPRRTSSIEIESCSLISVELFNAASNALVNRSGTFWLHRDRRPRESAADPREMVWICLTSAERSICRKGSIRNHLGKRFHNGQKQSRPTLAAFPIWSMGRRSCPFFRHPAPIPPLQAAPSPSLPSRRSRRRGTRTWPTSAEGCSLRVQPRLGF